MMAEKGVKVLELRHTTQTITIERFWSDKQILDLFPDEDGSICNRLLRRAQKAETETERLQEDRDHYLNRCRELIAERDDARKAASMYVQICTFHPQVAGEAWRDLCETVDSWDKQPQSQGQGLRRRPGGEEE